MRENGIQENLKGRSGKLKCGQMSPGAVGNVCFLHHYCTRIWGEDRDTNSPGHLLDSSYPFSHTWTQAAMITVCLMVSRRGRLSEAGCHIAWELSCGCQCFEAKCMDGARGGY